MPDKDLESQALKHGAIASCRKPFFNVDVSRAVHKALDLKMPSLTANWSPEREVKRSAVCPADDDQDKPRRRQRPRGDLGLIHRSGSYLSGIDGDRPARGAPGHAPFQSLAPIAKILAKQYSEAAMIARLLSLNRLGLYFARCKSLRAQTSRN